MVTVSSKGYTTQEAASAAFIKWAATQAAHNEICRLLDEEGDLRDQVRDLFCENDDLPLARYTRMEGYIGRWAQGLLERKAQAELDYQRTLPEIYGCPFEG